MPSAEQQPLDPQQPQSEDPQPSALRPQQMPTAELKPISPRVREQPLPEKDDDRFFDRWAIDKARELGARAVKRTGLDKLRDAIGAFAEWRSLRHAPAVERENMADRSLVASTPAKIERATAEAKRAEAAAGEAEEKARTREAEVRGAERALARYRPALRGTEWDLLILLLASAVIFAVDIFVIHVALGRIPGNEQEYWLTAITMGAGAVVVGEVMGWIAGVATVRKDGSIGRPNRPAIVAIAALSILSVWFFVELGDFREFAIVTEAQNNGVLLKDPTFFTLAQTLFLVAAAAVCFAYVARRNGRELLRIHKDLKEEHAAAEAEVAALRARAEQARQTAAEAPVLCEQAKERIAARDRIALGSAKHDRKQGEYLKALVVPEYMRERADVESGVRYWQFAQAAAGEISTWILIALGAVASLAAGGIAFWVVGTPFAAVATTVIVGLALYGIATLSEETTGRERDRVRRYVARLMVGARKGKDRATDIEQLVPQPPLGSDRAGGEEARGNGHGDAARKLSKEERAAMERSTILYRDDG